MSLVEYYFRLQREYEEKYGDSVCVLIQVGKFYEIYQYEPSREGQVLGGGESNLSLKCTLKWARSQDSVGKAVEVSFLLNMALTSKNKEKPHTIDNPLMMGFPCPAYENHRDLILMNGYKIILVNQKKQGDLVEREVVDVCSLGTELNAIRFSNRIVSIYLERIKGGRNFSKTTVVCGLSSLDICTGQSSVAEIYSKENDESYALLEIYRFLERENPTELILHVNKVPQDQISAYEKYLHDNLELDRFPVRVVRTNRIESLFFDESYQESVLHKAFGSSYQPGSTHLISELNLELMKYGLVSYLVLLQYCYEHNQRLITRLQKPEVGWTDQEQHLILTHNAIRQLDLVGDDVKRSKRPVSLLSVLDLTLTPIGSRYLREQLLNPITDGRELEVRYTMTDELLQAPQLVAKIEPLIRHLPDLERLQRKAQIGLLKPRELVSLFNGYFTVQAIYRELFEECCKGPRALSSLFLESDVIEEFNRTVSQLWTKIDFEKLDKAGLIRGQIQTQETFFHPGQDPEIDELQSNLGQFRNWLQMICQHLNELVGNGRGKRIEPTYDRSISNDEEVDQSEDLSIHLYTTPGKANSLMRAQVNPQLCGSLEFHEMRAKSKTMITSQVIRQVIYSIEFYQKSLEQKLTQKYTELVALLGSSGFFLPVAHFVAKLDFVRTNAHLSLKYNYHRPIIEHEGTSSFIRSVGMRHPLVERLIRTEYIPSDLELKESGLLLYGVNASGKTCTAKKYGSVIIMAQIGFFVPGKLWYRPYHRIITRLTGEDNLKGGKSSFIVEMEEANTILRNADGRTLVLGDELCRGTESLSGMSLTVSMINTLVERRACFIFSTHMHHLPEIEMIKGFVSQKRLQIKHLTAEHDLGLDQLVYSRKLEEGPGSSLYGLEVCKSLAMDPKFLELANTVRRELEGISDKLVSTKRSRYHSGTYVDICFFCKKSVDLETHHLREQSKADTNGYIDHVHKNASHNLLVICDKCHEWIHAGTIKVMPQQTLHGINLKLVPDLQD